MNIKCEYACEHAMGISSIYESAPISINRQVLIKGSFKIP